MRELRDKSMAPVADLVEIDVPTNDLPPVRHIFPGNRPDVPYCGRTKGEVVNRTEYTGRSPRYCQECVATYEALGAQR